jgi:hypothetical protein
MSTISIALAHPDTSLQAAWLVHKVTGIPLALAQRHLANGPAGIFYCAELFLNDHPNRDREIRTLIEGFRSLGIELRILDTYSAMAPAAGDSADTFCISAAVLENLLNEAKGQYR